MLNMSIPAFHQRANFEYILQPFLYFCCKSYVQLLIQIRLNFSVLLCSGVWHSDYLLTINVPEILEATINKGKLPQSHCGDEKNELMSEHTRRRLGEHVCTSTRVGS